MSSEVWYPRDFDPGGFSPSMRIALIDLYFELPMATSSSISLPHFPHIHIDKADEEARAMAGNFQNSHLAFVCSYMNPQSPINKNLTALILGKTPYLQFVDQPAILGDSGLDQLLKQSMQFIHPSQVAVTGFYEGTPIQQNIYTLLRYNEKGLPARMGDGNFVRPFTHEAETYFFHWKNFVLECERTGLGVDFYRYTDQYVNLELNRLEREWLPAIITHYSDFAIIDVVREIGAIDTRLEYRSDTPISEYAAPSRIITIRDKDTESPNEWTIILRRGDILYEGHLDFWQYNVDSKTRIMRHGYVKNIHASPAVLFAELQHAPIQSEASTKRGSDIEIVRYTYKSYHEPVEEIEMIITEETVELTYNGISYSENDLISASPHTVAARLKDLNGNYTGEQLFFSLGRDIIEDVRLK